jgi:hypothetical protein
MRIQSTARLAVYFLLFVSLLLQAYILFLVALDIHSFGAVGIGAGMGYGAALPISIVTFLTAWAVSYGGRIRLPMKWLHLVYFGSHLLIVLALIALPGKFGT